MSLSEQNKVLVKATLPLLQAHGEKIAERTYELMFAQYPQTKILFANFSEEQPKRLATFILAYCDNIDNLEILDNMLAHTAAKHTVADVHPGHYPMLGHSFLQAVREVLGKAVTEETIVAWKDAYFYLADLLVERENKLRAAKVG